MNYLHHASFGISLLGVLVIVLGVLCRLARFARSEFAAAHGVDVEGDRRKLRQVLGYYLLLGLEFLIAADIIDTLMKPTTQDLIILGAIVAIRTVINWSLNSELAHDSNPIRAVPALRAPASRRHFGEAQAGGTPALPEGMP